MRALLEDLHAATLLEGGMLRMVPCSIQVALTAACYTVGAMDMEESLGHLKSLVDRSAEQLLELVQAVAPGAP